MAAMAIAPLADAGLGATTDAGSKLAHRAVSLALTLDELGDIDIPDPVSGQMNATQLRALASLYLASDLESAGIIPSAEALTAMIANGAASLDLGGAEKLVVTWWRHRAEKLAASERAAFFSRLFGTASGPVAADATRNFQFEELMLNLCEALYKLDEAGRANPHGDIGGQMRLRSAARALVQNLGSASAGVTAFTTEMVGMLKDAFAILGHADLRRCFGARDVWGVVAAIQRLAHLPPGNPPAYVRRGRAGMIVIAWLADVRDALGGAKPLVTLDNPVIASASDWIEATLDLGESSAAAAAPPPQNAAWAALGR